MLSRWRRTALALVTAALLTVGMLSAAQAQDPGTAAGRPGRVPSLGVGVVNLVDLLVIWEAARPNGSPIRGYLVRCSGGKQRWIARPGARQTTFRSVSPGWYGCTVQARNAKGLGPAGRPVGIRIPLTR